MVLFFFYPNEIPTQLLQTFYRKFSSASQRITDTICGSSYLFDNSARISFGDF